MDAPQKPSNEWGAGGAGGDEGVGGDEVAGGDEGDGEKILPHPPHLKT
ncbi:hypothetical protein [Nostoc sp. ChiQUE01b]|nr:hypothetical protein [Nostoc sp. ChiQUE01b]MDZ8261831.1 hypothetical protein [Nostoc sp. ChiQUE01b]